MDYYYGTALTIGGDIEIRVNPENILGDAVLELEMRLPHVVGHTGTHNVDTPAMKDKWVRHCKTGGSPAIYGSKVQLDIDGEKREFRFISSDE